MALVLDTGVVLALLDGNDRHHRRCVELVSDVPESLVVPAATLVEIDYWVRTRLTTDVWQAFVQDLAAGAYRLEGAGERHVARAAELQHHYVDLGLGFVDASVIELCERLAEPKVATLDHRDFSVVVPRHVPTLRLLPQ